MHHQPADLFGARDDQIIAQAMLILEQRMRYNAIHLSSPTAVKQHLVLRMADLGHEEFHVLFLDAQNRLIAAEAMFRGTLTQTSVFPREVVKAALRHNAAGVIFAHNHPSGSVEPSAADRMLTSTLQDALRIVDVRVHDHIIIGGTSSLSFAERGLI